MNNNVSQKRMKEIVTKEMLKSKHFFCCGWYYTNKKKKEIKLFEWNKNNKCDHYRNINMLNYYLMNCLNRVINKKLKK